MQIKGFDEDENDVNRILVPFQGALKLFWLLVATQHLIMTLCIVFFCSFVTIMCYIFAADG